MGRFFVLPVTWLRVISNLTKKRKKAESVVDE